MQEARAHFEQVDPILHAATAHLVPFEAVRPDDPYVALLRAITGQQLSVQAADAIWGRVEAHFGPTPPPRAVLDAEVDTLRSLGLSARKAAYVQAVATEAEAGRLDRATLEGLSDEALIARLTTIRGVGRWTVEMILMFGMGRPDVFAVGDLGLQQAVVALYDLEETGRALNARIAALSAVWSPHRTAASRLLWAWRRASKAQETR
jgi:DNA-3-methyladenine glycosylase II